MSASRILFIDAYDSFSNNITTLLKESLHVEVQTIKIDDNRFVLNDDAFFSFLDGFDAVVAGPGPGHPGTPNDVGLIAQLWSLPDQHILPVLGICMGFQSLCLAHGAQISRLREPRHGIITSIAHQSKSIFEGAGTVSVTQYHSLHAQLDLSQKSHECSMQLWTQRESSSSLAPLAWDLSDGDNGPILMAVQHCTKPYIGMQFHPESVCTNFEGRQLVHRWWRNAQDWNKSQGRQPLYMNGTTSDTAQQSRSSQLDRYHREVHFRKASLATDVDVLSLQSALRISCLPCDPILLQSGVAHGAPVNSVTGRYSIIGFHDEHSVHIRYSCEHGQLEVGTIQALESKEATGMKDVFMFLEDFVQSRRVSAGPDTPFWGGLMGFLSYEAGLESLDVQRSVSSAQTSDVGFVMVERSIVLDHVDHCAYVQSLRSCDDAWLDSMLDTVSNTALPTRHAASQAQRLPKVLSSPVKDEYCQKVVDCQSHLRAGSSYELCLTEQTTLESTIDAWELYERLSKLNPAPFGAYIRLQAGKGQPGVSIVGSSPERFLGWSRQGHCQFRPIKGTVPKSAKTSKAAAEVALKSTKEQAENLMIVDLIRHDLAGVQGVSNVKVSSLMNIEEYATVYQLVSVIEGDMEPGQSGVGVLAASLPPGSMTGAPKRRSCELLRTLEQNQPRGVYSGVVGYLDVGGAGDFSVVIRTAFKWDTEPVWRVGAGGAVTVLSSPDAEFDEMMTKRERLIAAFS